MRYRDLNIQTQREAPNNARTQGFAFLVRAGYLTRENQILPLGRQVIDHLQKLVGAENMPFFSRLSIPTLNSEDEVFFPISTGSVELIACPSCGYTARKELALFKKTALPAEDLRPLEKVHTPGCSTIESLADFLDIPKEKTAKALMFTRIRDSKFVFVVLRGDTTLSEPKFKNAVGDVRLATTEEITAAGAVPGFASPVGLQNAFIIVDDLIPVSPNLAAGANEAEYHLLNTNSRRDYAPQLTLDLALAKAGEACIKCNKPLTEQNAEVLATRSTIFFEQVLLALAESYHDDKGLTLPFRAAPFDIYLMHVPGRELDTRAQAEEIYRVLQSAGYEVLFDDRDERAGVKFNDADLIGCPLRVTVGEKNLKEGMVELKPRTAKENRLISIQNIVQEIKNQLNQGAGTSH